MARYSIDGQILTDIADFIREKDVPKMLTGNYDWDWSYTDTGYRLYQIITVPNATKIVITNLASNKFQQSMGCITIVPYASTTAYDSYDSPADGIQLWASQGSEVPAEIVYENTNTVSFSAYNVGSSLTTTISAHITAYDADGNIIDGRQYRDEPKAGITPEQMVDSLNDLPIVPSEALNITGSANRRFAYDTQNWLIDSYGDRLTTNNITACHNMFVGSGELTSIPFEINIAPGQQLTLISIFSECYKLKTIPKINGQPKPSDMGSMFYMCQSLRNLPEDIETWFDWSYIDSSTGSYSGGKRGTQTFSYCYSLRSIPIGFLSHINPYITGYSGWFYGLFQGCACLDEIIGLPIPRASDMNWTSNNFISTFSNCQRLKNMTFATNEDGSPIQVNWKNQVIDLSSYVGFISSESQITYYNSGITKDKAVTNAETYEALKNDPDWYSNGGHIYSRYDHDSAVRTINSLPDTTISGGTNTIKFKGDAGSATDGGAINTLTAEEIAVATAKGWTVSLV